MAKRTRSPKGAATDAAPTTPAGTPAAPEGQAAAEATASPESTGRRCLCGCGETPKPRRDYRQGHDARLVGFFTRALRGQATADEAARAQAVISHPAVLESSKAGPLARALAAGEPHPDDTARLEARQKAEDASKAG